MKAQREAGVFMYLRYSIGEKLGGEAFYLFFFVGP